MLDASKSFDIDGFSIPKKNHASRADAERKVREQLKRLAAGPDPFEEDPELFNESDPVAFAERVLIDSSTLEPIRLWEHQKEDLRCQERRIVHQDGREVGKTIDIVVDMMHKGFTTKNQEFLLATPLRLHYNTILIEIEKQTKALPYLKKRVIKLATDDGYPYLLFPQGTIIHLRAGHPKGDAFRSLHVNGIWVDEGAYMPDLAWKALLRCLKQGFIRVYSTPDGRRTSPYYNFTKSSTWRLFRWPSKIAPTWTEQKELEAIEDYGGRGSLAYQHEIEGEHGEPTMLAFDQDAVQSAMVDIDGYIVRRLFGADFKDIKQEDGGEEKIRERLLKLLKLPKRHGVFRLGGDLGFSKDPSELVIDEETPDGIWTPFIRIHGEQIPYPIQAELIAILDAMYVFASIGFDRGNNGLSVYQLLTTLDRYRDLKLSSRLFAIDFGATLFVGFERNKDGEIVIDKPIKKYAKVFATELLNEALRKGKQRLPASDSEQESQFVTQVCSISGSRITYSDGNDHILDGRRCQILAAWLMSSNPEDKVLKRRPKAFSPSTFRNPLGGMYA